MAKERPSPRAPESAAGAPRAAGAAKWGAGFEELRRSLAPLASATVPWAVAGGWAVDLWVGRVTRPHGDVDVAIFRGDERSLGAALPGWSWKQANPPGAGRLVPWDATSKLVAPVHELHARAPSGHELEFLLEERRGRRWVFRRDNRAALGSARFAASTGAGVAAAAPEVVLLYKAKAPRARDEQDFEALRPVLSAQGRRWLRRSLETCYPGHPWTARL